MQDRSETPPRRTGGRSTRVRDSVLAATVELLADAGLAGLTIQRVATRADVNKSTIYRRWPDIQALVADALDDQLEQAIPQPDTGTLRGDLRLILDDARTLMMSPGGKATMHAIGGLPTTRDNAPLMAAIWSRRFTLQTDMIRRAIERGELAPDIDIRFTQEMVAAPLNFKIFALGDSVDDDYLDRVVDYLVNALAIRPPHHE